jgi:hypothetical protein
MSRTVATPRRVHVSFCRAENRSEMSIGDLEFRVLNHGILVVVGDV